MHALQSKSFIAAREFQAEENFGVWTEPFGEFESLDWRSAMETVGICTDVALSSTALSSFRLCLF